MDQNVVTTEVTAAKTWLQKHERIIITALVLSAGSWFGNHYLNVKAANADETKQVAIEELNAQKARDVQLAGQVTQLNNQYLAVTAQLQQQNAQLASAMSNRTIVLQQQQAADKTMPLPDLGNRLATLAGFGTSEVTASTSGLTVTDTAARATVAKLEEVPVLTQNLKDETDVANNNQMQLNEANGLIAGLHNQVGSLTLTVADDDKACTATVNDVKAQANKSKVKWFKAGFVTGFLSGLFVGHRI